jgi:hypothetical protein
MRDNCRSRRGNASGSAQPRSVWLTVDTSFLLGLGAGIGTAVAAWYIPNKSLVPSWRVTGWHRIPDAHGRIRDSFHVANAGRRDIVDVTISCTLFSTGWGDGNPTLRSAVSLPTSQGRIDFMPGRGYRPGRAGANENWGPRVVVIQPEGISDFQLAKLNDEQRELVAHGRAGLGDLCRWGSGSTVVVAVTGVDAFSGTRRAFRAELPAPL